MKKSSLTSLINLLAATVALISINIIASVLWLRLDLTDSKAFTLSEGTKKILSQLDSPVTLRFYAASSGDALPPIVKNYIQRIQDLLSEMAASSKGNLRIESLQPTPDSDAEDSAKLDGIQAVPLPNGDTLYLGLSVSKLDRKVTLPFLAPDREPLLEYDIARMIASTLSDKKPVVGILTSLPVFGQPMSMMMMGGRGPKPWILLEELKRDFDVREFQPDTQTIPDDVNVLLLIHPKNISDATEYAIDQFVMRGGRLIAFLDPFCVLDSGSGPIPIPSSSNLPKILPAWGIQFTSSQVIADLEFIGRVRDGRQPAVLDINPKGLSRDDVLTAGLDNLLMAFAGSFSWEKKDGIQISTLVHSSPRSQLVEPMTARMSPESILNNFQPSEKKHPLAIRLSGKFPSAFDAPPTTNNTTNPDTPDNPKTSPHLKESQKQTDVILIADADLPQDQLSVNELPALVPGGRMVVPINGNLLFVQSAVEQFTGSSDLIAVRSRASLNRPFTVIRDLEAAAQLKFQNTIRQLEENLQETERRLNELQAGKQEGQQFILSAEQLQEIENFRTREAEVRRQLKQTRRELRAEIDRLVATLKWLNITAVPALVILAGIAFAIWKNHLKRA